ncbi:MAG: NUDIX domain-containing protein [Oscillospiraceae bacterium]|nr:NUDIX domain-containing protein [Oscillospiraceae bacterium]
METFDVYDKNRLKTGRTLVRGEQNGDDYLRLVVHICIINRKGEMLIQQRQSSRHSWADMWDVSVGGGVLSGETPCQAAEREAAEELGLKIDFSGMRPAFTVNFVHGFDDYFIVRSDPDISSLKLQQEEVKDVKWASLDEIFSMIDDGSFIPYHKNLIGLLFDMKEQADARNLH